MVALLLISFVHVDAALFRSETMGISVGDQTLNLNQAANNLLYGVVHQDSIGSLILLQKGSGNDTFRVDVNGNVTASGKVEGSQLCIQGDCKTSWSQVGAGQWVDVAGGINYSGGNVGIGTTAPGKRLDVSTSVNTDGIRVTGNQANTGLIVKNTGAGGNSWAFASTGAGHSLGNGKLILFSNEDFATSNARLTVDGSGNVGIGTTAPNKQLHVKTGSGNAEIDIQSGGSGHWGIYQDDASDQLRFWNVDNRLLLDTGGNLQLPTGSLNVFNDVIPNRLCLGGVCNSSWPGPSGSAGGDLAGSTYPDPQIAAGVIVNADISGTAAIAGIKISPNFGSQNIVTTANAGIGTAAPGARLDVQSDIPSQQKGLIVYGGSNTGYIAEITNAGVNGPGLLLRSADAAGSGAALTVTNWSQTTSRLVVLNNGNVGINISNPSQKLHVNGNIQVDGEVRAQWLHATASGNNTIAGDLQVSGDLVGGGLFTPGSNEKLRIQRGVVLSNGTIKEGSGFSVNKLSTGVYQVNFTAPFSDEPSVTITPVGGGGGQPNINGVIAMIRTKSSGSFEANIVCTSNTGQQWNINPCDKEFNFIAIGPR